MSTLQLLTDRGHIKLLADDAEDAVLAGIGYG